MCRKNARIRQRCSRSVAVAATPQGAEALVVPNDNRTPAGVSRENTLEVRLEARQVTWRPDNDAANTITVLAFAEEGRRAQIPGPLLRVAQGTEVRITVRNSIPESAHLGLPPKRQREEGTSSTAGPELTVHGLRAGTVQNDTLHIPTGTVRDVRFRASKPGTFLYWGAMSRRGLDVRTGNDAQLSGAILVDPVGTTPDPDERIFVITFTDAFPDPAKSSPGQDIFEPVINGLSWPHTERLYYALGDTVRWRWVNATFSEHPMHLHGFHFRTLARGDGVRETIYPQSDTQLAVTELMEPGSTLRMEWIPTRAGNWLMHCHLMDHITPFPERDEERARTTGITPSSMRFRNGWPRAGDYRLGRTAPRSSIRDRASGFGSWPRRSRSGAVMPSSRGFVVQGGSEPSPDVPTVPGPPLILTRGETTSSRGQPDV